MISAEDESKANQQATNNSALPCNHSILYGIRSSRDDYSEVDLRVAGLMNNCIKRTLNKWLRLAESKSNSSRSKRDTILTLKLSCQQAVVEQLNFAQYKGSYKSLLDLFSISIVGGNGNSTDPAALCTNLQRVQFLERFTEELFDKLCGGRSSLSSECLPTLIASINNLPDAY